MLKVFNAFQLLVAAISLPFLLRCNEKPALPDAPNRKFVLQGELPDERSGIVKLLFEQNDTAIHVQQDSCCLQNGRFSFSGTVPYPQRVWIEFIDDSTDRISKGFFLDTGTQVFSARVSTLGDVAPYVTGTAIASEFNERFQPFRKSVIERYARWQEGNCQAYEKYNGEPPRSLSDSLESVRASIYHDYDSLLLGYIRMHPDSYVGLWFLYDYARPSGYNKWYDSSYSLLSNSLKNTYAGREVNALLNLSRKTAVGERFPTLHLAFNSVSTEVSFAALRQKYLFVEFWFSQCSPCLRQFPELKSIYREFGGEGFEIAAVSTDRAQDRKLWKRTIERNQLPWPQYRDVGAVEARSLGIESYPANFLLEDGRIIAKNLTPAALRSFLERQKLVGAQAKPIRK